MLGCGVTALNSKLTFTGTTTFLKNTHSSTYLSSSEVGAGAIFAVASSLEPITSLIMLTQQMKKENMVAMH